MMRPLELTKKALDGAQLRESLFSSPLVLIRGAGIFSASELPALAERSLGGEVLAWNFGPVMEMKEDPAQTNYLFSREKVPFHWDGAFHRVPRFLVFNCIEAPPADAGGETLFADTHLIWKSLSPTEQDQVASSELEYVTEKLAHYGGTFRMHMLQTHPVLQTPILRYAEPVLTKMNPVSMRTISGELSSEAINALMEPRLYDAKFTYTHTWARGDLLVADNHSLLHARHAFLQNSPRHLRRVQII